MGDVGQRRTDDTNDCCRDSKKQKGQQGNPGGVGGDAGLGGDGGTGGESGYVRILVAQPANASESQLTDAQHPHVTVSALPGNGGKPGLAGTPGAGGSGGPGLMTKCKRADWFQFNKICTFP